MNTLSKVVGVDIDKCVNCHRCIAVCPVKFCNNGFGNHVVINDNLCIGCGSCITACTHGARYIVDDLSLFLQQSENREKMIAIVAPAVVTHFPDAYLRLNGWLKSLGVEAVFDVSFGAELTVKSYIEHIKKNNPKTVIAQPCPSVVTFIQIYKPELIQYLAPADSPMLHAIKMIKIFIRNINRIKYWLFHPVSLKNVSLTKQVWVTTM